MTILLAELLLLAVATGLVYLVVMWMGNGIEIRNSVNGSASSVTVCIGLGGHRVPASHRYQIEGGGKHRHRRAGREH